MSIIPGKYTFTKQENGKEFYSAIGVPSEIIAKSETSPAVLEVIVSGNNYTLKSNVDSKTISTSFQAGKEFEDVMPDGFKLASTATIEGNKIIIKSNKDGKSVGGRTYEFSGSELTLSMFANGNPVVCKRYYKKN